MPRPAPSRALKRLEGTYRSILRALIETRQLNRYLVGYKLPNGMRIVRKLPLRAQGATSQVYLAKRRGRRYAIKIYKPWVLEDPREAKRIINELRASQRVSHPNIVVHREVIVDRSVNPPIIGLVMDYVPGPTMSEFVARSRSDLDSSDIVEILSGVCKCLVEIHRRHKVHRDIKPANVKVTGTRGHRRVVVLDFGVIKEVGGAKVTESGRFLGTLRYAAPEWVRGKVNGLNERLYQKIDLYSLGACLYFLLTRNEPYYWAGSDRFEVEWAVRENPLFPENKTHPRFLLENASYQREFLMELGRQLTAQDPKLRLPSAAQVLRILENGTHSDWWLNEMESESRQYFDSRAASFLLQQYGTSEGAEFRRALSRLLTPGRNAYWFLEMVKREVRLALISGKWRLSKPLTRMVSAVTSRTLSDDEISRRITAESAELFGSVALNLGVHAPVFIGQVATEVRDYFDRRKAVDGGVPEYSPYRSDTAPTIGSASGRGSPEGGLESLKDRPVSSDEYTKMHLGALLRRASSKAISHLSRKYWGSEGSMERYLQINLDRLRRSYAHRHRLIFSGDRVSFRKQYPLAFELNGVLENLSEDYTLQDRVAASRIMAEHRRCPRWTLPCTHWARLAGDWQSVSYIWDY